MAVYKMANSSCGRLNLLEVQTLLGLGYTVYEDHLKLSEKVDLSRSVCREAEKDPKYRLNTEAKLKLKMAALMLDTRKTKLEYTKQTWQALTNRNMGLKYTEV